jgi:hypothetical protein
MEAQAAMTTFVRELKARHFAIHMSHQPEIPNNELWVTLSDFASSSIVLEANLLELRFGCEYENGAGLQNLQPSSS